MSELKDLSSEMLDDEYAKSIYERTSELLKMLGPDPLKAHVMVAEEDAIGELATSLLLTHASEMFTTPSVRPSDIPAPGMRLNPVPSLTSTDEILRARTDIPEAKDGAPIRKPHEVRDIDESSIYEGYMVHLNLDSQTFMQKLIGDEKTPEVAEGVEILPSMSGTLRRIAPDLYHEYEEALLEDEGED